MEQIYYGPFTSSKFNLTLPTQLNLYEEGKETKPASASLGVREIFLLSSK